MKWAALASGPHVRLWPEHHVQEQSLQGPTCHRCGQERGLTCPTGCWECWEWTLLRKQPSEGRRPVCVTALPPPIRSSLSEPVQPPGEQGCQGPEEGSLPACQVLGGEA